MVGFCTAEQSWKKKSIVQPFSCFSTFPSHASTKPMAERKNMRNSKSEKIRPTSSLDHQHLFCTEHLHYIERRNERIEHIASKERKIVDFQGNKFQLETDIQEQRTLFSKVPQKKYPLQAVICSTGKFA